MNDEKTLIVEGVLNKDTEIDGITFQGGTEINFDQSGGLSYGKLAKDQVIGGIKFMGNQETFWSTSGKTKASWVVGGRLAEDTKINGIVFKTGSYISFSHNEPNMLELVELAQDQEINGVTYHSGQTVQFDIRGQIRPPL